MASERIYDDYSLSLVKSLLLHLFLDVFYACHGIVTKQGSFVPHCTHYRLMHMTRNEIYAIYVLGSFWTNALEIDDGITAACLLGKTATNVVIYDNNKTPKITKLAFPFENGSWWVLLEVYINYGWSHGGIPTTPLRHHLLHHRSHDPTYIFPLC